MPGGNGDWANEGWARNAGTRTPTKMPKLAIVFGNLMSTPLVKNISDASCSHILQQLRLIAYVKVTSITTLLLTWREGEDDGGRCAGS